MLNLVGGRPLFLTTSNWSLRPTIRLVHLSSTALTIYSAQFHFNVAIVSTASITLVLLRVSVLDSQSQSEIPTIELFALSILWSLCHR